MKLDLNSKTLVLLQGLPGSGKSTFVKKYHLEPYTLCKDEFRILAGAVSEGIINQNNNGLVKRIVYMLLEARLQNGKFTVIDETNVDNGCVEKYKEFAARYGFEVIIIRFNITYEESCKRNLCRGYKNVPRSEISKLNGLLKHMNHNSIPIEKIEGVVKNTVVETDKENLE